MPHHGTSLPVDEEERRAIARLRRGDLGGLETLVARYQVKAVQAASLIVQDRALAEDIVQNAFIVASDRIHQFDPQRPFGPWFYRSVANAAIKAARREQRKVSLQNAVSDQDEPLLDRLADPRPGPEEWLAREENRERIQAAIDELPAEQRAVIVMRFFLDMSAAEMADEAHRPQSTIKYWLRTARKLLKRFLTTGRVIRTGAADPSMPLSESYERAVENE